MSKFSDILRNYNQNRLTRTKLTTLQVNMGDICNQYCLHCHIDASPRRKNIMSRKTVDDILEFLTQHKDLTLDITGGAPEMNSNFNYFVHSAKTKVKEVIVRTNLTVFFEQGKDYLPYFFKENKIHLICSLPCFTKENVDSQRGEGVFEKSIKALKILNSLGFAQGDGLRLDLMCNPMGSNLSAQQETLEKEFKSTLMKEYSIVFDRLLTITNAPIKRFKDYLKTNQAYEKYLNLLKDNFNPEVLDNLMCRSILSVGYDGKVYDCDFNQALCLALKDDLGRALTIDNISIEELQGNNIIFGEHCFACTAGWGSSCQGKLAPNDKVDIRDSVKHFYSDAVEKPKRELCCPTSYEQEDLSYIPKEVLEISYGCASPISLAQPKEGEVVVDLGCGAGIDCFIVAKKVGILGKVIGIDMTQEMLDKANVACEVVARNLGFLNCEFRKGFLEEVPVESESVDLVTSNCVVNLSFNKSKVFAEVFRILKDEGRFVIADIVSDKDVPVYMQNDRKLWGECISGALTQGEFLVEAKQSGFYGLRILKNYKYKEVEGIQFCSITVEGYKFSATKIGGSASGGKKGKDCVYIGQYATYLGPYSEVRDDDNHIFPRGIPVEICTDTAEKLRKPPYRGAFIITNVKEDSISNPCCPSSPQEKPCC